MLNPKIGRQDEKSTETFHFVVCLWVYKSSHQTFSFWGLLCMFVHIYVHISKNLSINVIEIHIYNIYNIYIYIDAYAFTYKCILCICWAFALSIDQTWAWNTTPKLINGQAQISFIPVGKDKKFVMGSGWYVEVLWAGFVFILMNVVAGRTVLVWNYMH